MHDLISRQAAIKAICEDGTWLESQGCAEITMAERKQRDADILGELPSAERKGKWIHDGYDFPHGNDWIHCSECGKRGINVPADLTNFCPNCGARMERKEE